MKKILALALVILMAVSLCGCTFSDSKTALESETLYGSDTVYSDQASESTKTDSASDESTSEPTTVPTETQSAASTTSEPSLDTSVSDTTLTTTKANNTTAPKKESTTKKAETTKRQTESKPSTTKTTSPKTTQTTTKANSTTSPKKETTTKRAETTKKQEQTESSLIKCTIKISCETIFDNEDKLKENKKAFVPKSGKILNSTEVTVPEGSSAFDVLKKACENNVCTDICIFCQRSGIQFDFMYTPGFDSNYIRGIHQIYEKDCGTKSGWIYTVNGVFQNVGCNKSMVHNGDVIEFVYTCDLSDDI